jgi:hypothetical protein
MTECDIGFLGIAALNQSNLEFIHIATWADFKNPSRASFGWLWSALRMILNAIFKPVHGKGDIGPYLWPP